MKRAHLSSLILIGAVVLAVGAAGDFTYHLSVALGAHGSLAARAELLAGADAVRAHVVTLVGMVLTLAGVVQRGIRRREPAM